MEDIEAGLLFRHGENGFCSQTEVGAVDGSQQLLPSLGAGISSFLQLHPGCLETFLMASTSQRPEPAQSQGLGKGMQASASGSF